MFQSLSAELVNTYIGSWKYPPKRKKSENIDSTFIAISTNLFLLLKSVIEMAPFCGTAGVKTPKLAYRVLDRSDMAYNTFPVTMWHYKMEGTCGVLLAIPQLLDPPGEIEIWTNSLTYPTSHIDNKLKFDSFKAYYFISDQF